MSFRDLLEIERTKAALAQTTFDEGFAKNVRDFTAALVDLELRAATTLSAPKRAR